MAIFTQAEKTEQLLAWRAALLACSTGQEYTIGSRRLRRADLPEIRQTLSWLDTQPTVEEAQRGLGGPLFTPLIPGRGGRGSY